MTTTISLKILVTGVTLVFTSLIAAGPNPDAAKQVWQIRGVQFGASVAIFGLLAYIWSAP